MLIFLDTAFTDQLHCELISLALVADGGDELYIEFTDYAKKRSSAFVREAVEPLLGKTSTAILATQAQAREHVYQFLVRYPDATLACNHNIDWWLLTDLLEEALPFDLKATNVQRQADQLLRQHYYVNRCVPRNHTLHDARASQFAYAAQVR